MATCSTCKGRCRCPKCLGSGKIGGIISQVCALCKGRKVCIDCNGRGTK